MNFSRFLLCLLSHACAPPHPCPFALNLTVSTILSPLLYQMRASPLCRQLSYHPTALFGPSLMLSNIVCNSTCHSEDLFTSDGWCRVRLLGDHLWPRNVGWLTTLTYTWIKERLSHVRITQRLVREPLCKLSNLYFLLSPTPLFTRTVRISFRFYSQILNPNEV